VKKIKQPLNAQEIGEYQKNRRHYEIDIMQEVLASRTLAWRITSACLLLLFVAIVITGLTIYRYSQPLPPYLLTINKQTGEVSQLKMTRDQSSYGEAIDKYWLTQYVRHRESYDYYSIQADYDAVGLMSAPQVVDDYLKKFSGPQSIDKVLGSKQTIDVKIRSVMLDRPHGVATVRFETVTRSTSTPDNVQRQAWIVILGYEYQALTMNAQQRFINPLGFRITSYRLSTEIE